MSISWRFVSFTQSLHTPYIIRCNPKPLLVLLVCLCKIFQRTLSFVALSNTRFLKSECKSTNYFRNCQIFQKESFIFVSFLTVLNNLSFHFRQRSLLYTCAHRANVCTYTQIIKVKNKLKKSKQTGFHIVIIEEMTEPSMTLCLI